MRQGKLWESNLLFLFGARLINLLVFQSEMFRILVFFPKGIIDIQNSPHQLGISLCNKC